MRIKEITNDLIIFDNDNSITFKSENPKEAHPMFRLLKEIEQNLKLVEFDEKLDFEAKEYGFCFGQKGKMICVVCEASSSTSIEILYNNERKVVVNCIAST
jgi:hypothetical protein